MTNQQGAPEALHPITRYEVVDCIDSRHVPAVIPNGAGPWVRYEDHVAALVEAQQPAQAFPITVEQVEDAIGLQSTAWDTIGAEKIVEAVLRLANAPPPAPSAAGPCVICGSDEPFTGTCGSGDPRALCKQPSPTPQADGQPAKAELFNPLEDSNAETALQMAAVIALRDSQPAAVHELDDDACRCEPSDYVRPADYDGDGSVAAMARRAARAPADSVTAPAGVAYLDIGAGGYIDLGTDLSNEALSRLPKGRHVLIIAGTYGIDGYIPTPPAQAADSVLEDAAQRWAAPKYDHKQRQWCIAYETETGFDPMMDDYEAGLQTFAEAAVASLRWYEDHTRDAHLRISSKTIPGGPYDAARAQQEGKA